jgi:hypothetical protein
VNVTVAPDVTAWLVGCSVTAGSASAGTVSVAACVVAEPASFVNTARLGADI